MPESKFGFQRGASAAKQVEEASVSVKFMGEGQQDTWRGILRAAVERLIERGTVRKAHVEVVFPQTKNPALASLFVVRVDGSVSDTADALRKLPGVDFAQVSPTRRIL